ncbi:MAG TPA: PKD domain-containing protein, partial [Thermoplasmata archaeon]|nr:PKD domain-containing protein [Thermoplasmata archaeon]
GVASAVDPTSSALLLFGGETKTVPLSPWTYVLSAPPVVNASASRPVVDLGMAVTFHAIVTGGFAPNSVSWDFADGSANASGATATHSFSRSGIYLANVTATSRIGTATSARVAVYVNPTLSVNASVAGSPTAGRPTAFALGVTGGDAPYTYQWSFGDSTSSHVATPSHTYASAGTFTATVRVTDNLGASLNQTLTVVVGAAPSTAVSLTSGTGLGLLLGLVVLVVIIVALAALLMRKPKGPAPMAPAGPPPVPYTPPPPPPT